jgi:hypothetical protein
MLKPLVTSMLVVAFAAHAAPPTPATAPKPAAAQCTAPEVRQFDFWLGDWDTFETDGSTPASIARTRVEPIAGGCAIHELYEQTDGLIGDSILSYDPVKKAWQQTWVTNRGGFMYLTGVFKDGAVTLQGESHMRDGKTVHMRITWKAEGGNVRESAVMSKDGGKTWKPAFDVTFKKRQMAGPG